MLCSLVRCGKSPSDIIFFGLLKYKMKNDNDNDRLIDLDSGTSTSTSTLGIVSPDRCSNQLKSATTGRKVVQGLHVHISWMLVFSSDPIVPVELANFQQNKATLELLNQLSTHSADAIMNQQKNS